MTSWSELRSHREWLAAESARLLAFARGSRVDGGFGWLDAGGELEPGRQLQLWITARMTHVFALGDLLGQPGSGPLADHGLRALGERFADPEHGGWLPEAGETGPRGDKDAYPHSFVLLAAASGAIAGREPAGALLEEAARVVEQRFWSEEEGACLESWDRAWTATEPYRGANANMHMVEAFLAAGDATGNAA
jgi:sulfoquinovose isomerase